MSTRRLPCPQCDKGPKDTAYAVTTKSNGTVLGYCHRCRYTSIDGSNRSPVDDVFGQPKATVSSIHGLQDWAQRIVDETVPITKGTVAYSYLKARSCVIPPEDSDLRYHPKLRHPSKHVGPALVGIVTDVLTNKPITIHRTWITETAKADLDPPRLYAKEHRKKGGVIRLYPDDAVTLGLGIAEGIESALAVANAAPPVWACLDASNMKSFPVLDGVDCLSIYADNDKHDKGLAAAHECGRRWLSVGKEVHIYMPKQTDQDWNDRARNHYA